MGEIGGKIKKNPRKQKAVRLLGSDCHDFLA
jgi:hypothetical protein